MTTLKKENCISKSQVQGGPLGGLSITLKNGLVVMSKASTDGIEGKSFSDYQTLIKSTSYNPGQMRLQ